MLGSKALAVIKTWLHGRFAGEDAVGNRFYESTRSKDAFGRLKRWVMYKGVVEPSKVSAEWHGWLHYTHDEPCQSKFSWQKKHLPNLTGTQYTYLPRQYRSVVLGPEKPRKDYEPWQPN